MIPPRRLLASVLLPSVLLLGVAACAATREPPAERYQRCGATAASGTLTSPWLAAIAFIDLAEAQRSRGCYAVTITGVQGPDGTLYRAAFKPAPDNILRWHYEIGIGPAQAREMDQVLGAAGYTLIWSDIYTDTAGAPRLQFVWTKTKRVEAGP
ncbi:MAG: hypothetical protein JNL25_16360 [Rhodospirillaceae bacterium]|nr:hypothetical protein [Rhodospirillaceae bacterium]